MSNVAAVDCGTNSTRLLIMSEKGATLSRVMTITRLGEGVDETGRLSKDAIARTIDALSRYRKLMDDHEVSAVRAAATSAARDAKNAEDFFAAATAVLGVRPELLAGVEEGRLAYLGATASLRSGHPYLVIDVGGGSTELIAGSSDRDGEPNAISLDIGCVRLTERFLKSDPPRPVELDAASRYVSALLASAIEKVPELNVPRRAIGVAGTVSCLAAVHLGLSTYDFDTLHHVVLSRASVEALYLALGSEPTARRRRRAGMEPGRADVIVGGALVVLRCLEVLAHDELIVSETDILDGLAATLLDVRRDSDAP